ncbi:hypothetical protein PDESU_00726 [Pontiella desulfatans]|uniref:Glycosyltransferase RgtA/B/C/D-like domain-containing protein n=1 Tax=Pontiella desulfatans TaxID=2750659 RepID=A0A6C2TWW2_PONDE|nr:DUF2723 domain-containing protein [Pontiella desulfatans]VGO12175.1 hypothetical protein PDESU_00726 [Pontiella desulfatans]
MSRNILQGKEGRHWFRAVGMVGLLALFYFASGPVNRTEAEDAYEYAWRLENESGMALLDAHHLLFLPLAKVVSTVVPHARALGVLGFIGSVATALMLYCFYRVLHSQLGVRPRDALVASLVPGVSYGVWRYAAEAEIYALSGMFAVWLLAVAIKSDGRIGSPVVSAIIAAMGSCIHIMNVLPAFAVGVVCLCRKQWRGAVVYGMAYVIVLLAVVGVLVALGWDAEGMHDVSQFAYEGSLFSPRSYPRAVVGIGSGVLSSQFVFAWETVGHWIAQAFPGMGIAEEMFFGKVLGMRLAVIGTATLVACFVSAIGLAFKSIKGWRLPEKHGSSATLAAVAGLWLLLYALIVFRYDPAAPEFWIQAIPAIFLFIFSLQSMGGRFPHLRAAFVLFLVCMLLHNGLVGMLPLKRADADYNAVKASPLLARVEADDLVLSSGSWIFYQYLRYHCPCDVVYLFAVDASADLECRIAGVQGQVYGFDDLGNPPSSLMLRYPEQGNWARKMGLELRDNSSITIVQRMELD